MTESTELVTVDYCPWFVGLVFTYIFVSILGTVRGHIPTFLRYQ